MNGSNVFPPKKILFCKLRYIGDTLLLTGTIRATKRAFPEAEIWVAVREGTEGILAGCPEIDRIATFAAPADRGRAGGGFRRDLRTALELRRERFDIVFELGSSDRGRYAALLCGAGKRVTNRDLLRSRFWRFVFAGSPAVDCSGLPAAAWDLAPVAACFGWRDTTCPPPVFDRTRVDFSFLPPAPGSRPHVVVHPVAGKPEKIWPEERWAEVVSGLAQRFDIVLSCGPSDAERAFCRRVARLSGIETGLRLTDGLAGWAGLAGLLYSSKGYVGADTAAMHLASACGVPVVAVFGHNDALNLSQWTPVGPDVRVVTFAGNETSVRDIPPERVLAAAEAIL